MRIQHNITAMNSYRNFSANNSSLSKNLEKLSSGYKINRAGDDAAGLAISEKMRAQITGLEGAKKNATDGISLIQTAEGALTEVHDMLNRMVTLAEQSANGTYQDELDREQLQKEVDSLKSEIDRIADSTNFNGLKLLDGSLGGAGGLNGNVNLNDTKAVAGTATIAAFVNASSATKQAVTKGDKLSYTMTWEQDGKENSATVEFTVSDNKDFLVASDGTSYALSSAGTAANYDMAKAVLGELQKNSSLTAAFDISRGTAAGVAANDSTGVVLKFESKVKGSGGATVTSSDSKMVDYESGAVSSVGAATVGRTQAYDSMQKIDFSNLKILTATNITGSGDSEKAVRENTFEIDGKKFAFIGSAEDYDKMKDLIDDDITMIQLAVTPGNNSLTATQSKFTYAASSDATSLKKIAAELSRVTGREFSMATAAVTTAGIAANDILLNGSTLSKTGKSLDLQIGDTADSFNKLSVTVNDMHSVALGVSDVDISTQDGAAAALDKIKAAVNSVSDTRGSLGALQNRLDHTINNLGVMQENIQNAESAIRDTDVASEMMEYTKNSILNQSAQAMLAQANQLPQGVLQLLQ